MSYGTSKKFVIIGAGASGILMGVRLRERGLTDFVILEQSDDLGGTWHHNKYPGIACDVPAAYYSYSFEPNGDVGTTYATGAQLWDYFNRIAHKYDVASHIQYNTRVQDATWDGLRWTVTTSDGDEFVADVVISAVGRLHRPKIPSFAGIETFAGTVKHSSQWDPDFDLAGKRLGVIGVGSSGVQITAASVPVVDHLTLFQRTPQWIYPVENETLPQELQDGIRESPEAAIDYYNAIEDEFMAKIAGIAQGDTSAADERDRACLEFLGTVRDPELRAKLTPDYPVGCKRLVMSEHFYTAVQQENCSVITDGIDKIEPQGVRTDDGVLHELDVIILATGFHADSYLRPMRVTGEDGTTLDDIWAETYVNYKSVALPSMPNFFTLNGPFSPGGSTSVLTIIENHVGYVSQLIDRIVEEDVAISPRPERCVALLAEIVEVAKKTVWYTGGCTSWYLDKNGVPLVNPLTLPQLRADMEAPIYSDYVVRELAMAATGATLI